MITIKNRVKKIKINTGRVRSNLKQMLKTVGYPDFDIGILFTTNKTIKVYNKKYRKKDKPTDILSFPYHPNLEPGQKIVISSPDDKNLGDMIISLEYAKRDATAQNRSLMEHVNVLLAHGIAHLLGYDHKADAQHEQMMRKERLLLASIHAVTSSK